MSYKLQLREGKKIEREHYPTYKKIRAYHTKTGKNMPREKFAESIAKDHLKEYPDYYSRLKKANL